MNRLIVAVAFSIVGCATAACSLSPMPNCKDGEYTCESEEDGNGGALFQCKENDSVYIKNCAFGCNANGNECAKPTSENCTSGTTRCATDQTMMQCDGGTWKLYECEGSCKNDVCTIQECTDSQPTCSDEYTIVSCIDGHIQNMECDINQKCDKGNCVEVQQDVPVIHEICDDIIDNDNNGQTDCDDPACKDLPRCLPFNGCEDTCQHCKIEKNTFTICSGKGLLEYQNLEDDDRYDYSTLIFKGEINLDDAGKTTTPDIPLDTPCQWADWRPLEIPEEMDVKGENAHIFFKKGDTRCSLPKAFFNSIDSAKLKDVHFDFDYYGFGTGVLIKSLSYSTIENITYTGSATDINSSLHFALIKNAYSYQANNITINLNQMINQQALQSTESGKGMAGFIGTSEDGEIKNLVLNADKMYNKTKGGLSGLIGDAKDSLLLEHVAIKIKEMEIASEDEYMGGLIHDIAKDTQADILDTYIQIDKFKHDAINKKHNSAAIIGNLEESKETKPLSISNCVVRIKSIEDDKLSGVIGDIQPTYVSVNDLVIISDSELYGSILGTDIMSKASGMISLDNLLKFFSKGYKNIVITAPGAQCNNMILNNFAVNPI
ncbi:MAG: hypothetical protein J6A01_10050, partial [Proteobacteria bacterium]|nr:hypothetical protein [Pseudomonadota bacterium]